MLHPFSITLEESPFAEMLRELSVPKDQKSLLQFFLVGTKVQSQVSTP